MGTTYSITVGYGYALEEKDAKRLAKSVSPDIYEGITLDEWIEECGWYEVLDYAVGYGTELDRFDISTSYWFDYTPEYEDGLTGLVVYLKSATETYYGPGHNFLGGRKPLTTLENEQLTKLEKILRHHVPLTPFAEMSVG